MSQYLHELCCLLVEEFYGIFHASIYAQLTPRGCYNAGHIAHRLHLPVRQVKSGLTTLVQQRLVHHHMSGGLTTYQADTKSTYNVLRCGKLIELAQKRHGQLGGVVVRNAFLLGFCTVSELVQRVRLFHTSPSGHLTNGHHDDIPSSETVYSTVQALLEDRFLANVRSAHFQSDFDALRDAEIVLANNNILPPAKGRKGLLEYEIRVEEEKRRRQSITIAEHGFVSLLDDGNSLDDTDGRPAKRRKHSDTFIRSQRDGHQINGSVDVTTNATVLVGVNYLNVVNNIRNRVITDMSTKKLGKQSALVMEAALLQIPATEHWLSTMLDPVLNVQTMQEMLNQNDRTESEWDEPLMNGHAHVNGGSLAQQYTLADVNHHMSILAESLFPFVDDLGDGRAWGIDKDSLDQFLRQNEILRLVGDRLEPPSLRILRMLIKRGKLDEKTLQEAGLLGAKQLRQTLAELNQMGYVDLQEVPREAQRQPNRTIFLWFHDSQRVCRLLLETLYKTMIRLLQRLKIERRQLASTLEKVERSDVQGSEERILSPPELKMLRRLRRTEEWLMGELGRLDDSVTILRDL